jgi:cell division septum initiation protein DivIVA
MTEPTRKFSRTFRGYDPAGVDAHVEMLTTKQRLLLDDVESLRAKLQERGSEAAALRQEVTVLTDTSPSPHAMQLRMAKMLRRAVEGVSEMKPGTLPEPEAMIAAAETEIEAAQREHEDRLADMTAQLSNLEAEYRETRERLDAELAGMRADAQEEREQLLADAKQEADHYLAQARRAVDEATRQRITILEQLMGVYRDLDAVPATLERAYQELKNPTDGSALVASSHQVSAG